MQKKIAITLLLMMLSLAAASAIHAQTIVRKSELHWPTDSIERVIVGKDTVSIIIPEYNFGRFDRGLRNYLFIPKGKWGFGLTASYGELNTEDVGILSLINDIDIKGKMYSVKPYLSYFVRSNQSVGLRFDYSRGTADLGNLALDFDEDLAFAIHDVSYYTQTFAVAAFYRNYVGIGTGGRFAIFNEVELGFGSGSSRFKRLYNDEPKDTRTYITQASLNFSPGVCVFIQENTAFQVSFGVFGLKLRKERQVTDGVDEGSRFSSGANFRFNIFNISFGLMVVI